MYKISGGKRLKDFLKVALEHNLSVLISGPPGCGKSLPPDEKVVVVSTKSDGPVMSVPITSVKEGDKVIGIDANNKVKVTAVKRKVAFEHEGDLLVVKTRSGRVVRATPDHSFLVLNAESGKFVPCKGSDLKVGDIIPALLDYVQNPVMFEKIVEIEKVPYKGLVYDLETDTHNFLTSQGIFVHNSEITTQAAAELDMPIDELRLYLMEPGEAKGLPDIRGDATYWTRPDWLPSDGKRVLFFDDIHLASEQLQSPLFELLLCHRLHGHETSAETRFVAAGNLSLHSAGASELLAPVMDRFDIAVEFSPTMEDFIQYASSQNVSSKISAFLLAYPEYLYDPDPPTSQKFPSPRSWFSLHKVLAAGYDIRVAVGVVGINAGTKFIDSYPLLGKSINDLLKTKPESVKDQVVIAAALSRHKPNVKVLDFVAKKLNAEAQMCYVMGEMAFNFDDIYKLADHPILSKITDELIKKMEGK